MSTIKGILTRRSDIMMKLDIYCSVLAFDEAVQQVPWKSEDYIKRFVVRLACDPPQPNCLLGSSSTCGKMQELREELAEAFENEDVDEITYRSWVTVDRTNLETITKPTDEFRNLEVKDKEKFLSKRFLKSKRIEETQKLHAFIPVEGSTTELITKEYSRAYDKRQVSVVQVQPHELLSWESINGYITCKYDGKWWLDYALHKMKERNEAEIKFLHPSGPAASFTYPAKYDILIVQREDILTKFLADCNTRKSWIARVRREGFTPSSSSYVCSKHFLLDQFTEQKSDAPERFRRKQLIKGAIPNLNLCGNSDDERVSKRKTLASLKAAMPITLRTASTAVHEVDSQSTLLLSDVSQPKRYGVGFVEPKNGFLEIKSKKVQLAAAEEKNIFMTYLHSTHETLFRV
eukprot:gene14982-6136_t